MLLSTLQGTGQAHGRKDPVQNVCRDQAEKSRYRGSNSRTDVKPPAQGHRAQEGGSQE